MDNRFYFQGVFYDNQEDFIKATMQFANSVISPVSVQRVLTEMNQGICMNVFMLPIKTKWMQMTNAQFMEVAAQFEIDFIKKCREIEFVMQAGNDVADN